MSCCRSQGAARRASGHRGPKLSSQSLGPTVFVPRHRSTSIGERATTGLPPDLLNRVASRLEILAWLYAFTFFMAAFFPAIVMPAHRQMMMEHWWNWAPGVISIADAVAVAVAIRLANVRPATVTV